MNRISNESIPVYEPEIGNEELVLLEDVIKSNWLSEGKYVRKFEEKLRKVCVRRYALAFNNCTAALITGMKSMGIGEGDDVIVQSMVHSADPNSIAATAANPIFAEVDERKRPVVWRSRHSGGPALHERIHTGFPDFQSAQEIARSRDRLQAGLFEHCFRSATGNRPRVHSFRNRNRVDRSSHSEGQRTRPYWRRATSPAP